MTFQGRWPWTHQSTTTNTDQWSSSWITTTKLSSGTKWWLFTSSGNGSLGYANGHHSCHSCSMTVVPFTMSATTCSIMVSYGTIHRSHTSSTERAQGVNFKLSNSKFRVIKLSGIVQNWRLQHWFVKFSINKMFNQLGNSFIYFGLFNLLAHLRTSSSTFCKVLDSCTES